MPLVDAYAEEEAVEASAESSVDLIDLVAIAATTDQEKDIEAALTALDAATKDLATTGENEMYALMVRNATLGDTASMFQLAKFFCVPHPVPDPVRCERLLRVAIDLEMKNEVVPQQVSPGLNEDPDVAFKEGDERPGEVEFYLGTQFDEFTPWWHSERASPDNTRCLRTSEETARSWYRRAAFKGHGTAAYHLFFVHAKRQNRTQEDGALAKYWLNLAVKLGSPVAIVTRADMAHLTVRQFLSENERLWGKHVPTVRERTALFLAEQVGVSIDEAPSKPNEAAWPPSLAPGQHAGPPAPSPAVQVSEGVDDAADVIDLDEPPIEDEAPQTEDPPPRKEGLFSGVRRLAGAFRRHKKPKTSGSEEL